jgi:hypothetical protein
LHRPDRHGSDQVESAEFGGRGARFGRVLPALTGTLLIIVSAGF